MGIKIEINASSTDELRELVAGLNTAIREGSITGCSVSASAAPVPQQAPPVPQQQPTAPTYAPPQYPQGDPQQQQGAYPPVQPPTYALPGQQPPSLVPTSAPSYTMEQLGVAAGPLVDAGRSPELTAWINQRGAAALSQLDKSYYGEFATFLRSLGAKI